LDQPAFFTEEQSPVENEEAENYAVVYYLWELG
jgi:hypothetical protein